jgi:hypothetical protein
VDALINVTAPVSGNYYLGVTDSGDELGGYTLSTARVATDDRAADASTTGRVAVGGSTSGTVETARDVDWFAVTLEAGIHYRFRLEGNGLADPYLVLYDNAGTECTHDDDRGGLRNAQIDYVAPASGTFFLAASGAGDGVGPYTVSAQVAPADDFTADATTTGQVLVGGTARGLIETKADRDWFAVFLVTRGFKLEETLAGFWVPFIAADLGNFVGGGVSSHLIARGWRVGRARKLLLVLGSAGVLALAPAAILSSFPALVACFAIATFSYAVASTMALSLPADLYRSRDVATVSGLCGSGAGLGTIGSTFLIGIVADRFSFGPILVAASVIPLVAALLAVVLIHPPRGPERDVVNAI